MKLVIAIGKQDFEDMREHNCFYVDKTDFIKEWWESEDDVTLITRPRRFGKTLNMNTLKDFFSNQYSDRSDLFEGLSIWKEEKYRKLQGTYPVIFLSFAEIKNVNFKDAREGIISIISECYRDYLKLWKKSFLSVEKKDYFDSLSRYYKNLSLDKPVSDTIITKALKELSFYLNQYYNKKVIILLDEYDTPMQEAYINGYWDEMISFIRSLFNSTFKTNPYLKRGLMTGITRVSKESVFSDLNNLKVVTTTSEQYATSFGFTESEVFQALDQQGLSGYRDKVKKWYNGFAFGNYTDIYNPWSITNFLDTAKFATYWVNTSSNNLAGKLIREGSPEIKTAMEDLLAGKPLITSLDEEIVFNQLEESDTAIWSLLLASGYLKVDKVFEYEEDNFHQLSFTNFEVEKMFKKMINGWFSKPVVKYNDFIKALLLDDVKHMNQFMNRIAKETFSSFDSGNKPSEKEPERFYHGFVLGLIVDSRLEYRITSNRESGFGRYDVVLEPLNKKNNAYVFEFKVQDLSDERDLQDTVNAALAQIEEKGYDADLITKGIQKERIRHYGFAFRGKEILIGK